MDFDNRKVYGDTSITDGLVSFEQDAIYTSFISLNPNAMSALYVTVSLSMLV